MVVDQVVPGELRTVDRLRRGTVAVLVLLFFIHGGLYLVFPSQHYNTEGWLVWVKYVTLATLLLVTVSSWNLAAGVVGGIIGTAFIACFVFSWGYIELVELGRYVVPIATMVVAPCLIRSTNLGWVVRGLVWVTVGLAVMEYWALRGIFEHFAVESIYRVSSVFVNANVLGIVGGVLVGAVLVGRIFSGNISRAVAVVGLVGTILLSGSRTGLVVAVWGMLVWIIRTAREGGFGKVRLSEVRLGSLIVVLFVVVGSIGLAVSAGGESGVLRALELVEIESRVEQYGTWRDVAGLEVVFPTVDPSLVDNGYVSLWAALGLPGLIIVLITGMVSLWKVLLEQRTVLFVVLTSVLLAGVTTNVFYIWPTAYIFWGAISVGLFGRHRGEAAGCVRGRLC